MKESFFSATPGLTIVDAAQKLICRSLGAENNYQSVLNTQKQGLFRSVSDEHIQLWHDGANHWILSFYLNGRCSCFLVTSLSFWT